ncbi:MAG: hypothetical protein LBV80_00530 [Deltaproteobacteria bacterium]|nr:hypothetical protein [Deltaproteobacteria bacterium]
MTLDEAIKHAWEKAFDNANTVCGKEHLALAQWLSELKYLRVEHAKLLDVAGAADVVMHHFIGCGFQQEDFSKMIAAMEPLRKALNEAGYGLPEVEVKVTIPIRSSLKQQNKS